MHVLTPSEFLDYLKRSELIEPKEFDAALEAIKKETPSVFGDSSLLAAEFVKKNLLTSWHVRQLMKRKYKGFYLRQYRILGHLGSGGMSSVYLGEHTVMKRRVAIKVLPKKRLNPVYLDRFAREAQAIASLDSAHVVRAYDVDRFEDVHYIVMEYFEGQNLRQLVDREGPLAYEDAVNYIRQAALGLADAHKCGIVHRDVKPENIVVDEHDFVKILDLGLALLDENAFSMQGTLADEDKILGTADYLAPEQALDSHSVDARADVYGLGATLYFCLTGKPPFPFGTISERLLAHQRKEPASIFTQRPDAPVDLVEICARMMAKKPENRVQSASQVAEIMKQWLIHNGFAQPGDFAYDKNTAGTEDDFNDFISQSDAEQRFLLNNEQATEMGFARDSAFRLSDAELASVAGKRSEDAVDLYDATESGSISKLSKSSLGAGRSKSSVSDNLVLSKRATEIDPSFDPLELALNEIADTSKILIKPEEGGQNNPNESEASNQQQRVSPTVPEHVRLRQSDRQSNPNTATDTNDSQESVPIQKRDADDRALARENISNNQTEWYRQVPIWFWTVVISGYALAIFMAGILFTLLLNLKK